MAKIMTTPDDIIIAALKNSGVLGVGQTAQAEDMNDGFNKLNFMIAQWQRKRWLVYHLVDVSITCTGALSYTIGPGGDINLITRPDRLEAAFLRQTIQSQPNQVDYPLQLIEARETYNNIALKSLQSFPSWIFYDPAFPLGVLYPWPVPQASIYALHLSLKEQLNQFTSRNQSISLPLEYFAALEWNLTIRFCAAYRLPLTDDLVGLAKDSLNVIRDSNTQIPRLQMPKDIIRPGIYNIYSDQVR